jgi:hypothetical protein
VDKPERLNNDSENKNKEREEGEKNKGCESFERGFFNKAQKKSDVELE